MENIVPGHQYVAKNFIDQTTGQTIQFIHKEPKEGGEPGELETISDGTTNEELLEILLDRIKFLQAKFPCKENACCITHLEEGLMWLEKRTRDRIKRQVEGKHVA